MKKQVKIKVLSFAVRSKQKKLKKYRADFVGAEELIPKIVDGWFD